MTIKNKCLIICIIFTVIISITSCSFDQQSKIKNGFSNELVSLLKEKYHVSIPKDAIFIEGYYDNALQDDSVHIKFKVSSDLCNSLYDGDWSLCATDSEQVEKSMEFSGEPYTYLDFYPADDEKNVTVYFRGRHPGNAIE